MFSCAQGSWWTLFLCQSSVDSPLLVSLAKIDFCVSLSICLSLSLSLYSCNYYCRWTNTCKYSSSPLSFLCDSPPSLPPSLTCHTLPLPPSHVTPSHVTPPHQSLVGISHNVRRVFFLTIYDLCHYITEVKLVSLTLKLTTNRLFSYYYCVVVKFWFLHYISLKTWRHCVWLSLYCTGGLPQGTPNII